MFPPCQSVQDEGVVVHALTSTNTNTTSTININTNTNRPTTTPGLIPIPPPIMQLMRGFNDKTSPGEPSGVPRLEGMPYYMGAFLAVALEWRAQAKSKAVVRFNPSDRKWLP